MANKERHLTDYIPIVGDEVISEIMKLAQKVAGKSIKHVTAPSIHREVQTTINSLTPLLLLNKLGIVTCWEVIPVESELGKVLNKSKDEVLNKFLEYTKKIANTMNFHEDIIIIHDILPLSLVQERNKTFNNWAWCCHTKLNSKLWEFIKGFVSRYDSVIFPIPSFSLRELPIPQFMIPLTIDPLNDRNKKLSTAKIKQMLYNIKS